MYFVFASTSGGGVGSSRPRNDKLGVYDLVVGLTGLFGSKERNLALMFGGALVALGRVVARDAGTGVGRIVMGRAGARTVFEAAPGCGPGDAPPLGPGLGAVPVVRATAAAVVVGLGLGTPDRCAGAAEARTAGAAEALGAGLARAGAAAVGEAFGIAGAGDAAIAVARTTGAGGFGEGRADGAAVGAGDGAAVGGAFTATESGATVGTLTGAAGISGLGCVSKIF
jgi:hypothetical protein